MQENSPQFRLNNLEPGREYQFSVYAVNAKGRSEPPVVIERVRVAAQLGPYGEYSRIALYPNLSYTEWNKSKDCTQVCLTVLYLLS